MAHLKRKYSDQSFQFQRVNKLKTISKWQFNWRHWISTKHYQNLLKVWTDNLKCYITRSHFYRAESLSAHHGTALLGFHGNYCRYCRTVSLYHVNIVCVKFVYFVVTFCCSKMASYHFILVILRKVFWFYLFVLSSRTYLYFAVRLQNFSHILRFLIMILS